MKPKPCKICGEMFTPDKPSNTICKKDHFAKCPICGKEIIWNSTRAVEPCSKECRKELTKQKNIAKYGVAHPMQNKEVQAHHKQAMLDKYGVESPLQSKEIKAKAINTNREKFGSDWALGSKEIVKKSQQTMIQRYGAKTTLESAVLRQKVENTCLEKYGFTNPGKGSAKNQITNVTYMRHDWSKVQSIDANVTSSGLSFIAKLKEVDPGCDVQSINLNGYQYDICLPDKKVLFEINPSYTHNAIGNHWTDVGLPTDYHLNKSKVAAEAGYHCIHVFDWDDWDKVIDIVAPKKAVYARQCKIYKLKNKVAEEFLNNYHLQGSVSKQVLCLGLVKDDELIQVMTFGTPRYTTKYYSELLRLCTKPGLTVVGGAERLFKFATRDLGIDEIISYCDISKFKGDVYERIGMKFQKYTEPQEIWSRGSRKITANLLRQRGFDQLFGTNYGKGTSNNDLMIADGWLPVYDCGQAVYTFNS